MISRGIVPNLVLSQNILDKIEHIASQYLADETGESMVGFVVDSGEPETLPTIYVLDTISPDEASTLRQTHTFQQGDDLQDEIIWWLQENWRLCRARGEDAAGSPIAEALDTPLRYVGDWHKQPGFMIQPSGGDLMTALGWLDDHDNNMEFLLVPIVTLGHPSVTSEEGASVNYINLPRDDGTSVRIDWWYIHRDVRVFQPIIPQVAATRALPSLAGYPWNLTNPERLEEEVEYFRQEATFVEVLVYQADDDIPMELCFFIARPGGSHVMLVVTEHDYPRTPPRIRVAPFRSFNPGDDFYDIFESFWNNARPVELPATFRWESDMPLIDFVMMVEDQLGIKRPEVPVELLEQARAADAVEEPVTSIPIQYEDIEDTEGTF